MSGADINDSRVLGDLKISFESFALELREIVGSLRKTFEDLRERLERDQNRLCQRLDEGRDALAEARRDLEDCLQHESETTESQDCTFWEERLEEAERTISDIENDLDGLKARKYRFEVHLNDCERDLHSLSLLTGESNDEVQAWLLETIHIIERYTGGYSFPKSATPNQSERHSVLELAVRLPKSIQILTKLAEDCSFQLNLSAGHPLKHIGLTRERIQKEGESYDQGLYSTFISDSEADSAILSWLTKNQVDVIEWLRDPSEGAFGLATPFPCGLVFNRSDGLFHKGTHVYCKLRYYKAGKYAILTTFPTIIV